MFFSDKPLDDRTPLADAKTLREERRRVMTSLKFFHDHLCKNNFRCEDKHLAARNFLQCVVGRAPVYAEFEITPAGWVWSILLHALLGRPNACRGGEERRKRLE